MVSMKWKQFLQNYRVSSTVIIDIDIKIVIKLFICLFLCCNNILDFLFFNLLKVLWWILLAAEIIFINANENESVVGTSIVPQAI